MKKPILVLSIASLALAAHASAEVLLWNFSDSNATVDTVDGVAATTASNFTISDIAIGNSLGTVSAPISSTSPSSGYTGASGTGNLGNATKTGALDTSSSSYYTFTLTPATGYIISLSDFDFGTRSTATAAQAFALRSDVDGYATDILTGTIANNSTWALKDNTFTAFASTTAGAPVTFRLYTYNGVGSAGNNTINNRIDDVAVTAVAVAVPEPTAALSLVAGLGFLATVRRRNARA